MENPYELLQSCWGGLSKLQDAISRDGRHVISGENAIHARGFFPDLAAVAETFNDSRWWLLDLDGGERHVEFGSDDTEDDYFGKLKTAPEWAPDRPFPYAVRHQAFIGERWILLSDRDDERMHLIVLDDMSPEQLASAKALIRG
ncbi:hypothetical protein [Caulobacter sp. DWR1-3-2b1]|uniref:hypothetical protein n=1 Tax=Caulobacter sp. DWR1-3-2b1 TaxID=2804670 RepID=UPI003CE9C52E